MSEIAEVVDTLDRLNVELQDLQVRGLRVCGTEHLGPLRAIQTELDRIGSSHLSGRLSTLIAAIETDDRTSAAALFRTQASLRVFERVLTLRVATACLEASIAEASTDHSLDPEADE